METLSSWRQELSLVRGGAPECKRNTNNRKDFGQAIIKNDADVVGRYSYGADKDQRQIHGAGFHHPGACDRCPCQKGWPLPGHVFATYAIQ